MKLCSVPNCGKIHSGKGFCRWHYDHLPENKEKAKMRAKAPHRVAQRKIANSLPERKAYRKNWQLTKDYSISLEQFQLLFDKQEGLCAICKLKMDKPHTDHSHSTGLVRGLLCKPCNQGIGFLKEDISILESAIEYLKNETD